jgi:PAS domain S-box-containing protein
MFEEKNKVLEEKSERLSSEISDLRARLQEVEETLDAIRRGELDGLVISTPEGEKVYSISGAEAPYRRLIEEMSQGAILLSNDNIALYCNSGFSKIMRYPIEKILGARVESMVSPLHLKTLDELLSQARHYGDSVTKEITFQKIDGNLVPTLVSAISSQVEGSTNTFLVVTDLTQHMEDEVKGYTTKLEGLVSERTQQLAKSNQELKLRDVAQRDFINTAAHELRTPIQPLLTITEMLEESMNEMQSEKIELSRSEVEMLARNARRLESLTRRILDVTRMEEGRVLIKKEKFDLNSLLEETLKDLSPESRYFIFYKLSGEPLSVEADRTRIAEVISNLIDNALKYTSCEDGPGQIVVSSWKQDGNAVIRIRDSGPGMDKESMSRLFTKFFTMSKSGIGLGLYVSKMIVDAHDGAIWGEINQDGKGMSFCFSTPLIIESSKRRKLDL